MEDWKHPHSYTSLDQPGIAPQNLQSMCNLQSAQVSQDGVIPLQLGLFSSKLQEWYHILELLPHAKTKQNISM